MELLLSMLFAACLYFLVAKGKSAQPPSNQQNLQSHSEEKNDFAGQNIGSVFMIEEFVDPRTPGRHSAYAELLHDNQTFENEFEEEGWHEEEF